MKAYRIGRKPMGPWTNMTPPIRGGIYRPPSLDETDCSTLHVADEASSDDGASTGCDHAADVNPPCLVVRKGGGTVAAIRRVGTPDPEKAETAVDPEKTGLLSEQDANLCAMKPDEYTDWAVQQDIEQSLREYPSIDPLVQQDIVRQYRLLHQKIIDEGLYTCHFIEYAKEISRYLTLFTLFAVGLHYHWYMTSAFFLGLFWVSVTGLCLLVSC